MQIAMSRSWGCSIKGGTVCNNDKLTIHECSPKSLGINSSARVHGLRCIGATGQSLYKLCYCVTNFLATSRTILCPHTMQLEGPPFNHITAGKILSHFDVLPAAVCLKLTIVEHFLLGLIIMINQKITRMLKTHCMVAPPFSGIQRHILINPTKSN